MKETDSFSKLIVSLSAIRHNAARILNSLSDEIKLIPVLKADAFGLGMIPVAKALSSYDRVSGFAVAYVSEGLALRESGITLPVLVLGPSLPFQYESAICSGLTLTLGNPSDLYPLTQTAKKLGKKASVQIKFDTGLHRFGIGPESLDDLLAAMDACKPDFSLEGTYSHFADHSDAKRCADQYHLYQKLSDALEEHGYAVPLRHICDSAASEMYPEYALSAVRIGRRLAWDSPDHPLGGICEAATLQSTVTGVWQRLAGETIGYGSGITLQKDTRIASVGIGYGDGLDLNAIKKHLPVLLNGQTCSLLYSFMDHTLVDIGDVPCAPGDTVTLFGFDGSGAFLCAQEQASACGANEACAFTTALLPRVVRVYTC